MRQRPHIHIDFVPFITGSKRGLDTRVSLKQALAAQGFKGGARRETEWSQWVQSEKEQLAMVMERYGFEWEHKGTHEKHLSVLDYEKKVRSEEVAELDAKVTEKKSEIAALDQQAEQAQAEVKEIEAVLATVEKQQVKIAELEQKLSSRDSIREQMERGKLKSENDSLRKENQKLRDVLAAHGIPFGRKQVDRDSR